MNLSNELRWHAYFFDLCLANAAMSKDPSTKVGAVIVRPDRTVVSMGFNGFSRGCRDDDELYADRDIKLSRIIHAETNAILTAKETLRGCSLYVHPMPPCDRCAAIIVQAGIKHVYAPAPSERWLKACKAGRKLMLEAGVQSTWFLDSEVPSHAHA
jgi:dCMP deaminase